MNATLGLVNTNTTKFINISTQAMDRNMQLVYNHGLQKEGRPYKWNKVRYTYVCINSSIWKL